MTITTTRAADLNPSVSTRTGTSPASQRSNRLFWYSAAAAAVLVLAAVGIGYAVNQSGQETFVPFKTSNAAVTPDAAESVHGSGAGLRTGTGGSLTSPSVAGATSTAADAAANAHGAGQAVVTGSGQAVH